MENEERLSHACSSEIMKTIATTIETDAWTTWEFMVKYEARWSATLDIISRLVKDFSRWGGLQSLANVQQLGPMHVLLTCYD